MLRRFDRVDLSKIEKTPQGYLRIPASIARADCVLTYRRNDGSKVREFRSKEEVFKQESVDSARLLPVISDRHVWEVNVNNTQSLAKGFSGEVLEVREDTLDTNILITDKATIARIENGDLSALSPAYSVGSVDKTPGIHNGQRYDQIQRGIVYNHLALLPKGKGRQGDKVGLRLDDSDAILDDDDETINEKQSLERETTMKVKIRFDGKDYEINVANETEAQLVKDFVKSHEETQKRLDAKDGELDTTKRLLAEEKTRADSAEDKETINSIVKERIRAVNKLQRYDADVSMEDIEDKTIEDIYKDTLVASGRKREDFDDCSLDYLRGSFDALPEKELTKKAKAVGGKIPKSKQNKREDMKDNEERNPIDEMNANYGLAWNKKERN